MGVRNVLKKIGQGAVLAAEFTPQGAAARQILTAAGRALDAADPMTPRQAAVELVAADAPGLVAAGVDLGKTTDTVEAWLAAEAARPK